MTSLYLAVPDFPRAAATETVPRLGGLEALLARGRLAGHAHGWRQWILRRAGVDVADALPVAQTIAGRAGSFAVATPVHLIAGLEQVHFDPRGMPGLGDDEWMSLAAGFNALYEPDGLTLTLEHRTALLSMPRAVQAETRDPETLAGCEAGSHLPQGPDGGWLRRLMTEIQMWLYDHPVNHAREARGLRPVNAIWLWGTGGQALPAKERPLPPLATGDPFLRRFWQSSGGPGPIEATRLGDVLRGEAPASVASFSLGPLAGDLGDALVAADELWFAPLAAALASGRLQSAELLLGGLSLTLRPADRLRFWRRSRPWQEALA